MTQTSPHPRNVISRAIRSDQLRTLVLGAIDAGFDPYVSGSGHLRLVNPQTGQSIWMSLTSNGMARAYKNTRAALKRAGYTPKEDAMPKGQRTTPEQVKQIKTMREAYIPIAEIARRVGVSTKAVETYSPPEYRRGGAKHRHLGEVVAQANIEAFDQAQTAVAVMEPVRREAEASVALDHDPKMETQSATFPVLETITATNRSGEERAGGKYKLLGPQEIVDVGGYRVTVGQRVDGNWVAKTPDLSKQSRRRQYMDQRGRVELLDRIQADLVKDPPQLTTAKPVRPTTQVGDRLVSYSEPTEKQRTEQPLDIKDVVLAVTRDWTQYPTIRSLVDRQKHYAELLKLAEASRDDDVQLLVMSKMELTGLEKEAVDLWHATHGQTTNGTGGHTDE